MQATAARLPVQAWPRVLLSWLSLLLLAALPAALWTVALLGRTHVAGLSGRWMATWLLGTMAILLWARWAGQGRSLRSLAAGLAPAGALAGAALLVLYTSDGAYHRFVHEPLGKGLLLPATAVLALGAPAFAAGREMGAVLAEGRGLLVAVTLGGVGVLQALHLLNVATDDLIRYWAIADAFWQGMGYPVTEGTPGAGAFYLIDQPLYPLLILPAFQALGHRYLALHVPLILANALLPFVFYALARGSSGARGGARGASRLGALGLSLAVLCFPYYQVYALGAADPEPLWAVEAGLLLWLAMRVSDAKRDVPLWEWGALGVAAAAAALTRPEGTLYAGLALLGLGLHTRLRWPGWWLAGAVCGVPVALFCLFLWRELGVLSPSGWLRIASVNHLGPNLGMVLRQDLPRYAEVAGLPSPALSGVLLGIGLLALVLWGLVRLWRVYPALRFVPFALALNLAVILLTPPDFAGDVMSPQTFLRHLSVLFPWLVPGLALLLPPSLRYCPRSPALLAAGFGALVVAEVLLLAGVTGRVQARQATILTSDPYVLATDLWKAQDPLPWLRIVPGEGGGRQIDPRMDYLGFRRGLFAAVAPYDQHVNDAGRAYALATGVIAVAGLAGVGAGCAFAQRGPRAVSATTTTGLPQPAQS